MSIYQYRTSMTASSGSASGATLPPTEGLVRQVLIRARTDTTVFRADLTDDNSIAILNYPYHTGEINDWDITLPVVGATTVNITNASVDDIFDVVLSVEE